MKNRGRQIRAFQLAVSGVALPKCPDDVKVGQPDIFVSGAYNNLGLWVPHPKQRLSNNGFGH
jgi:hypothetical protein